MIGCRGVSFLLALAAAGSGAPVHAQETDPGRAPTGAVTQPGDLLKEADGTEFRFAYFPSSNRLRLLVLCPTNADTDWAATLSPAGKSGAPLKRYGGTLPMPPAGVTVEAPALKDGTYEMVLALTGAQGVRREFKRTFERKHFPWENSKLGCERVVIPPFTPLKVDRRQARVSCVLRDHDIAGNGLWGQIVSQGVPLLAAPMRIEIESGGKVCEAEGGRVSFSERSEDRVTGSAAWRAGPLRGRTDFAFGYDGLTKLTLHFDAAKERIEALRLVVPMRRTETWLMHPVTDLLRFHYAGRIPDGEGIQWDYGGKTNAVRYTETGRPDASGKVWDSRAVGRFQLPAPFVPYIWLGGPERGLCWFAENDRDWNVGTNQPALEIRRQGETVSLIVNLISAPTELSRPREVVFGLMATPAKPMPETPVNFRRWFPGEQLTNTAQVASFGLMGACYYWGSPNPCCNVYPAFKNFSIYDEFARLRKGGAMNPAFTENWLRQFQTPAFQPQTGAKDEFPANLDTYRAHVEWSLRFFDKGAWHTDAASGRTGWAIPYTNARAVNWDEEAATFMDEWSTVDIADPRWPGDERFVRAKDGAYCLAAYGKVAVPNVASGIAYAVDPVSSWQDMALWYHKRMLETFADGIYFDNYFLSANAGPLGPGYVGEDGRLRTGVNIFGFHDLAQRLATMQYKMGRRPLVFIHMTNANIVPALSFGTILLDHEWRDRDEYYNKDCQDRLNLDDDAGLLLAQSTGLQSGCLSVWHNLFHDDERIQRSALGVSLTHEIKCGLWYGPLHARTTALLANFGYGLPDCRVWRYWDARQPVGVAGVPAKTLVIARGGQALIVVTSYGPDGEVSLTLDGAALGLANGAIATNAETGERVEQPTPNQIRLALPRHDFRIVRVAAP